MKRQIANILTSCRIFGSILLLVFPVFSIEFYIIYLLCGFSDMIDGFVARKTNSNSSFGAKFDTAADFIFMIVVWYKLLPAIYIPQGMWIWIIIITAIKLANVILGLILRRTLIVIHSTLNKVTGFLLFLLPLTIQFTEQTYSFTIICLFATFSAIREGYDIRIGRDI